MVFYSYDNEDHLTALVAKNSGGALVAAYSYTYDALGRRTKMVDINGQTTTYVYDALSRLISVAYGNGRTQSFTYDDVGNRLTQTVNGVTTSYTYDAADRLTSETTGGQTTTYTYDNNSNRLSQTTGANTTAYTYDPFNQLTRLNSPDGSSFTFGYAADHKRVFEQFTPTGGAPARTDFVQAFGSVLAEYSPGGTTHNVSGPQTDELISQERNGQITYYVQDALGSVTVALDASGNVTGRRTYDAFGIPIDQSGVWPGRYSFTGREDIGATGLLYYRARVYDARSGRFITTDPVGATPSQPDSWNRFAYAQNDPVNLRDPSGESVAGVVAPIWTDFIDYVVNTLLFDVLKNSFKGLCKFNFYCQIGNSVIAAYEIYFTFLASFSTLLFTYGDMPNSDRAIYFITFVWPFLAEFVAAVEYFTYKDFTGWSWAFIQKAVKKVIVQTALKIFEFLVAEAAKALAKPYYKYIVDAYKVVAEVLKWLVLVVDGKAITDSPLKAGATILKLLLAPEIALLITVKIPALFGH
jgi:RHS repeat-associated protein